MPLLRLQIGHAILMAYPEVLRQLAQIRHQRKDAGEARIDAGIELHAQTRIHRVPLLKPHDNPRVARMIVGLHVILVQRTELH